MPRTRMVAVACAAGLLAGCGSSARTPAHADTTTTTTAGTTTFHGPPIATTGTAGKVGPGASGRYDASNSAVLYHVRIALVRFFTSKGFSGVTVTCKGLTVQTASCTVMGTNKSNDTSTAALTLSVDQNNGVLRITRVA